MRESFKKLVIYNENKNRREVNEIKNKDGNKNSVEIIIIHAEWEMELSLLEMRILEFT